MSEKQPAHVINQGRFERRLAHNMGKLEVGDGDCWIWGSTCFKRKQRDGTIREVPFFHAVDPETRAPVQVYARRWAWEKYKEPVPKGTNVVNVCGEPRCVRPDPRHNRPMLNGQWTSLSRGETHTVAETVKVVDDLQAIPPARTMKSNSEVVK